MEQMISQLLEDTPTIEKTFVDVRSEKMKEHRKRKSRTRIGKENRAIKAISRKKARIANVTFTRTVMMYEVDVLDDVLPPVTVFKGTEGWRTW